MKTMKLMLIGCLMIGVSPFLHAQSKSVAAKPVKTSAAVKPVPQKAAVKGVLPQVEIAKQIAQGEAVFSFLGTYSIYAGVQKLQIGKFTLREDGSYTVTVNSDQESYGNGSYEYNVDTKSQVWKAGLFVSNKYTGVLQKTNNAKLRILLSKSTYAEKID